MGTGQSAEGDWGSRQAQGSDPGLLLWQREVDAGTFSSASRRARELRLANIEWERRFGSLMSASGDGPVAPMHEVVTLLTAVALFFLYRRFSISGLGSTLYKGNCLLRWTIRADSLDNSDRRR